MAKDFFRERMLGAGRRPAPSSNVPSRLDPVVVRYPAYANLSNRLASFSLGTGWPADKSQTVSEIAEAGLFYAGMSDCTRCFCCGGGLRNWMPGDVAIVEHARFFPDCEYVRIARRRDVAADIVDFIPGFVHGDIQEDGGPVSQPLPPVDYSQIVRSVMLKPCGAALDVLGFPRSLVEDAVTKVLSQNGWDESRVTTQALASACLDLKEAESNAVPDDIGTPPCGADRTVVGTHSSYTVSSASYNVVDGPLSAPATETSQDTVSAASNDVVDGPLPATATETPQESPETVDGPSTDLVDGPISATLRDDPPDSERQRIKEENRMLTQQLKCKICLDKNVAVVYLPCGHLVTCIECFSTQTRCPLCRTKIVANVRTYI